jgi:TolB protein
MRRLLPIAGFLITWLVTAEPASAQQPDTARPPGIRLTTRYDVTTRAAIAVRPFAGAPAIASVADSMTRIMQRDLELSDRYNVLPVPATLARGAVDYKQWNALNLVYLVTGELTPTASGYDVNLVVHDVVYGRVKDTQTFRLPAASAGNFRLAVHALSDHVVRATLNAPGIAATRIAFTRKNPRGANGVYTYDVLVVDADGFNQRRIGGVAGQIYSPDWSPDGSRLLYAVNAGGGWRIVERVLGSDEARTIDVGIRMLTTPTYSPDGNRIAFSAWRENNWELFEYNIAENCCLHRLTTDRADDISPVFSRDGARLAFMSSRVGGMPHIFVMAAQGGAAVTISPYVHGQRGYYTSPDLSPTGSEVAFHGHWNSRGTYQIMLADASRPGGQVRQITSAGANEDPSWAPDGRHLVFTHAGVRGSEPGLYVIDTATGTRRALTTGNAGMRLADWSPPLLRASDLR